MLDPNYLLHVSEGAEEIAEKLHGDIVNRIINRIMLRTGRGEDYLLTAQDKWQISTLQQAGYLLEDIQQEIAKYTKLQQEEIAEAMEDAGVKALDYDDKIYQSVGLSPTPLTQSPELIRMMQRNYEATMGEWSNFTRTMADEAQRLFINQLDMAYTLVSTGALSYTQAVKEVLNNIVTDGVVVTYPSGHSDTIETATLRAVRTGISQATGQIQTARMDEMNVDLVITSSHLGARPSHQVWQGKVFSRSGDSKYPPFKESTGYGTVSGLCGANCRHSFSPYFEGMDNPFEQYDSEENRKQYEKEQYQRTLERRIRRTKREVMGLKESVDNCKDEQAKFALDMVYQKKAALLAKQNTAYKEYCERNNLRPLSDRIQIAKWDRQQAAAARGAAKRYENAHGGSVAKTKTKINNDIEKVNVAEIERWKKLNKSYSSADEAFLLGSIDDYESYVSLNKKYGQYVEEKAELPNFFNMNKNQIIDYAEKNISATIDFTGATEQAIKDTVDAVARLQESGIDFKGLKIEFNRPHADAYAFYDHVTNTIHVPKNDKFVEKLIRENEKSIAKFGNVYHAVPTYQGNLIHELGHYFDYQFNQDLSRKLSNNKDLMYEAFKISGYAPTYGGMGTPRASEAFAECFSAYFSKGYEYMVPKGVMEIIENVLKELKKRKK